LSDKRKIRFEYFEVVATEIGSSGDTFDVKFDLQLWLDAVDKLTTEEKAQEYFDEQAKLESFSQSNEGRYWFLTFTRLRETNIPKIAYIDDRESRDMQLQDDEYLGEHASAVYDSNLKILMLQKNRFSLSSAGVEEYINMIWKGRNSLKIKLRPILRKAEYDYIARDNTDYRKLFIRLADMNEVDTIDERLGIKGAVQALGEFEPYTIEIAISMGRKKGSLKAGRIKEVIGKIISNKDIVEKAEVSISKTGEVSEVLDLVSEKIMHDYIEFTINKRSSLNSKHAELKMLERFAEKKAIILESIRKD